MQVLFLRLYPSTQLKQELYYLQEKHSAGQLRHILVVVSLNVPTKHPKQVKGYSKLQLAHPNRHFTQTVEFTRVNPMEQLS